MANDNKPTDKTRVQPRKPPADSDGKTVLVSAAEAPTVPGEAVNVALTKIRRAMVNQDSSQGFRVAKEAADKALAEDKIVLNKRFVLEETLGAGGMGTVYRAKDLRKIEAQDRNPYVAIKVLNDEFKRHPQAFITLQREASRSHLLSHPNIVTVHDFDRDGDVIYMTMELLRGESLDTLLRQHRGSGLPREQAFSILRDIGAALDFAHRKSIVHSDLKPGNIFITPDGAKVLDFGIARLVSDAQEDYDAGSLGALTPTYASLEMIENQAPSPADDVYAAAIIAYELLCGKHPYERKPADVALREKRVPARIPGLKNYQWQALAKALQLRGELRTQNIEVFLRGLTQARRLPVFKLVSAVLLLLSAGLAYVYFFAPNQVQSVIEQSLANARDCYQQSDFMCSEDLAKTVLGIEPDNAEAKALLQQAQAALIAARESQLRAQVRQCLQDADLICAKTAWQNLQTLPAAAATLEEASAAIRAYETESQINAQLSQAQGCFEAGDDICTIALAEAVLALAPEHGAALQLRSEARTRAEARQAEAAATEAAFQHAMHEGENCMTRRDYGCAQQAYQRALGLKADDVGAAAAHQKALLAKQAHDADMDKAQRLVSKAKDCLHKKNYTCAITQAESAMEFIPAYGPAVAVRKQAQDEQERVKKSFTIQ